ncbi:helix-turn-helix transcriptional regulator [Kitasatospora sp. NPDC059795]|uniref:helix-turn-helix transcriptional regulator n=1 Tax=Kitasatospora sp. NPDC059795 TaxID=3346949 RepID=UPI003666A696
MDEVIAAANALRKGSKKPAEDLPSPEERARVRKAFGLTQSGLAEALGVHRLTVSAWERGAYDPTGATREQYLGLFRHMKETIGETE